MLAIEFGDLAGLGFDLLADRLLRWHRTNLPSRPRYYYTGLDPAWPRLYPRVILRRQLQHRNALVLDARRDGDDRHWL
jgi:hypothetical protein